MILINKTCSDSNIGTVENKLPNFVDFAKTNNSSSDIAQVEFKIPNICDLAKKIDIASSNKWGYLGRFGSKFSNF